MSKFNWLIDAGHGYNTSGKRSPKWHDGTQLFEFEFNRAIALAVCAVLDYKGIKNKFVHPGIDDMGLLVRCYVANDIRPIDRNIVVSIHGNAASSEKASGFEVFTSPGETRSDKVATIFAKHLKLQFFDEKHRYDTTDGDVDKEAKFTILTKTKCPAILTENGFFTNRKQCQDMLHQEWRMRVVKAHVDAIVEIERNGI